MTFEIHPTNINPKNQTRTFVAVCKQCGHHFNITHDRLVDLDGVLRAVEFYKGISEKLSTRHKCSLNAERV